MRSITPRLAENSKVAADGGDDVLAPPLSGIAPSVSVSCPKGREAFEDLLQEASSLGKRSVTFINTSLKPPSLQEARSDA